MTCQDRTLLSLVSSTGQSDFGPTCRPWLYPSWAMVTIAAWLKRRSWAVYQDAPPSMLNLRGVQNSNTLRMERNVTQLRTCWGGSRTWRYLMGDSSGPGYWKGELARPAGASGVKDGIWRQLKASTVCQIPQQAVWAQCLYAGPLCSCIKSYQDVDTRGASASSSISSPMLGFEKP